MTFPLVPFTAGSKDTAAALNTAFNWDRYAYTPTDQTVNNTVTLVNSTNLVLSLAASASYIFDTLIMIDTNATADFQYNFALPSGAFIRQSFWASNNADTTTNAGIYHFAADLAASIIGGVATGTYMSGRPTGIIITGVTAGNCQFQFAQNTANASNTVLKGGSWLHLRRVA